MKLLIELEEEINTLKNATFHKAYFVNNHFVIIIMDLGIATSTPLFTRHSRLIENKLRERLGINVKIIPKANDIRGIAMHLLYPARILGINTLWLVDGSIEYVVRIPLRDEKRLGNVKDIYEKVLSEIVGKRVKIMGT